MRRLLFECLFTSASTYTAHLSTKEFNKVALILKSKSQRYIGKKIPRLFQTTLFRVIRTMSDLRL